MTEVFQQEKKSAGEFYDLVAMVVFSAEVKGFCVAYYQQTGLNLNWDVQKILKRNSQ